RRWLGNGARLIAVDEPGRAVPMADVMDMLRDDPNVEYVERDILFQPAAIPLDPLYPEQWHYNGFPGSISLSDAWDRVYPDGFGGATRLLPVVVAIIDTGSLNHEDLVDVLLPGYDFISDERAAGDGDGRDDDPTDVGDFTQPKECGPEWPGGDSVWHGTHVMGTVGASTNNGIGGAGVAPNAMIVPVRALGRCGGSLSDVMDSIIWAAGGSVDDAPPNENPAKVINLSLAAPGPCTNAMQSAVKFARDAGVVVVVAAGNEAVNAVNLSPSNCEGAFTVAAVNASGGRAFYSNFGDVVKLAAPGGNGGSAEPSDPGVLSTVDMGKEGSIGDDYGALTGTSMAAPHVSGIAAMIFGARPEWKPSQVESVLLASVRPFPLPCDGCGKGIVDAANALEMVLPSMNPLPSDEVEIGVPSTPEPSAPEESVVDLSLSLAGVRHFVLHDDVVREAGISADSNNPLHRVAQYAVAISNLSQQTALNVTVSNEFPEDAELLEISVSQGNCNLAGTNCTIGDIGAFDEVVMHLAIRYAAPPEWQAVLQGVFGGVRSQVVTTAVAKNEELLSANNRLLKPLTGSLQAFGLMGLCLFGIVLGIVRRLTRASRVLVVRPL
ncbi:MAG: S8 family serine peptidase, partial [Gammaproteobacteria bacterium]